MGHIVNYDTCEDNKTARVECEAYWNEVAEHDDWQEGCSGLCKPIRWIDHVCTDYEEADEYIKAHDNGGYDQLAVKFCKYPPIKPTKTYETLKERADRLTARYIELSNNIHYKGVKSAYVSCKNCGSKLASSYFGGRLGNNCPICGADLRPESTLTAINNAKANAEKAKDDLRIEEKNINNKLKKNAKIVWLVKTEYHV